MDFRILGPLTVAGTDGEPLNLGTRKQRAVLALLIVDAGRVVSLDRIIAGLWADEAPSSATGTLQAYISQLRRILEPGRSPRAAPSVLLTREPGYLLAVSPDQVDAVRFTDAVRQARTALDAGAPAQAERLLTAAHAQWRGEPLLEFADEAFAPPVVARLVALRRDAGEYRTEALLELGRYAQAATQARSVLLEDEFRERSWAHLMLALYRDGRQAEALDTYRAARRVLDEKLGLQPGPELQALEQSILRQDAELLASAAAPAPTPHRVAAGTQPAVPVAPTETALVDGGAPAMAEPAMHQLVGRATQLRFVTDRVLAARHGSGGVLLVAGRAGVGKTTLTERAAERASAAGMVVAWSRCVEGIATPAFWPWVQLLRALPPTLVDQRLLDALTGRAEPAGADGGDPDAARFHLFEAAAQALRALSEPEPVLLIMDDIHLADASSLQLLAHVAADVDRLPILLLATMRSEPRELTQPVRDMLGALAKERGVQRLSLQPFTHEDVREYLRVEFARDRDGGEGTRGEPDDTVVTALHERTGGNPFYLKELLRLLDSEHLGGWGKAEATAESVVPDGVREVIGRRVARLPEDTQALLRAAAVIGRDVDADLLQATAGLDPERMLSVLEPAVATGLLVEMSGCWDYQFSHALVRDALYAELSRLQRSRIHRRVGEAMEGLTGADDLVTVGRLAHHFAAAARLGVSAKAVAYCQRAAELAEAQLAYDEAAGFLTTALGALDPTEPDARHRRCALLVALGKARRLAGDVVGAREVLDEAVTLGTRLGEDGLVIDAVTVFGGVTHWNWRAYGQTDARMIAIISDQLARLDPADHVRRAALLGTLGVELFYSERRDEGERFAEEAVGLARQYGDIELRARTLNNFCVSAWIPHRDDARLRAVNELLGLGPLPRRVEIVARLHRMMLLMSTGDLAAYDIDLTRCRQLAVEVRSPELAAQVTYAAGGRAMLDGRWDEGERLVQQAAEEQARTSLWGGQWIRLTLLYTSRRFQGRPADLLDELIQQADDPGLALLPATAVLAACESGDEPLALELLRRWGFVVRLDWSWDFVMYQWGLVAARLGAPDPAAIYDELSPFADRFVSVGSGGASWGSNRYVLAALADRLGRSAEAAAHATAALLAHERLGAPHLIAASQRQIATLASSDPRS